MTDEAAPKSWWRRRNWWKIAFFVTLFAFEVAREIIVIGSNPQAQHSVMFNLMRYQDFTSVAGTWKRTDKNEAMAPAIIKIECEQSKGTCTMVDVHMDKLYVSEPHVTTYSANFAPDNITFGDTNAACVTLNFRIDFKLKKVNAIREKKPNTDKIDLCKGMEPRVDLTLADSTTLPDDMDTHFVPVISALIAFLKLF